jgi:hypothetical protein
MRFTTSPLRVATLLIAVVAITGCASQANDPAGTPDSTVPTTSTPPAVTPSESATPGDADLPISSAAQRYVDAVNASDLDALVDSFAADGEIVDVSRRITGATAIRTWAQNEVMGGTLRVDEVTIVDANTQRLRVHWAPGGSGGWAADYTITTDGDHITLADLQYAD